MRRVTLYDERLRERTAAWLDMVMRDRKLTETAVAREMLNPKRRAKLHREGGATKVSQDAPRKKIKAWREGRQTITAHNAFAVGEALRKLGVPETSGFHVAFELGFGSDVAGALVALARSGQPKSQLAAFTIYSVLPRYVENFSELAAGSEWRESLQTALGRVRAAKVTKKKSLSLRESDALLKLALSSIGELSALSWKERDNIPGPLGGLIESLRQQEREHRRTLRSETGLADPISAWQALLFDWAIPAAYSLRVAPPDGRTEIALLSVALPSVSSPVFDGAWRELCDRLRTHFKSQTIVKRTI